MANVIELTTPDQIRAVEADWAKLLQENPDANFFQSPQWYSVLNRHCANGECPRGFLLVDGDTVVGIMPMLVVPEPHRLCSVRVLMPPLDNWGTRFGPIEPAGSDTLHCFVDYWRNARSEWEVVSLRWFDERRYSDSIRRSLQDARWKPHISEIQVGAEVRFTQTTWEDYWGSRPNKWRSNLRRLGRKLEKEHGDVQFRRWRGAEARHDQEKIWSDCQEVAKRSWQGRAASGVPLNDERQRDLLLDLHHTVCESGQIDVGILYVEDQPVAFNYNLIQAGNISGLRMGYDPAFHRYGVGLQLTAFLIKDSFQRRDRSFDLGVDYLGYKRHLATDFYETRRYDCIRGTSIRAQVLKCQQTVRNWWLPLNTRGASPESV